MIHALKTESEYFEAQAKGQKPFEVRAADRPYQVGDFLALNEWKDNRYTGCALLLEITYVLDNPDYCKKGFVILGTAGCRIKGAAGHKVGRGFASLSLVSWKFKNPVYDTVRNSDNEKEDEE